MKEHYVSYECAVKLKELGFDEPCEFYYNPCREFRVSKDCLLSPKITNKRFLEAIAGGIATAPRLDQAQAWMREKHHLSVEPICNMVRQWNVNVCKINDFGTAVFSKMNLDTYESALSVGLDKALELLGKEVKE